MPSRGSTTQVRPLVPAVLAAPPRPARRRRGGPPPSSRRSSARLRRSIAVTDVGRRWTSCATPQDVGRALEDEPARGPRQVAAAPEPASASAQSVPSGTASCRPPVLPQAAGLAARRLGQQPAGQTTGTWLGPQPRSRCRGTTSPRTCAARSTIRSTRPSTNSGATPGGGPHERQAESRAVSSASVSRSNLTSMWSETKPIGAHTTADARPAASSRRWSLTSGSSHGWSAARTGSSRRRQLAGRSRPARGPARRPAAQVSRAGRVGAAVARAGGRPPSPSGTEWVTNTRRAVPGRAVRASRRDERVGVGAPRTRGG